MANLKLKLSSLAIGAALAGLATGAMAGGFGIATQSGSGTGNAYSGGAAAVDDASVAWFNPAGMSLLPSGKHVSVAAQFLKPSFKYQDQGSTGVFAAPGTGSGGDGGGWALVPNGHFSMEINPQMRFGLSITVPFGLKTDYDTGWRGALTGLKSELKTININPSVAYKVSNTVSVGAGVSVQRIEAELGSASLLGGTQKLEADDVGYGYNLGVMVQATPATRIGAAYRSKIKYNLEGDAKFTAVPAANARVKADLEVPDSASLSVFSVIDSKWDVMADVTWTGWSSVQRLTVACASTSAVVCPAVGSTLTALTFNWDDTWRFGVGANYKLNSQTKLRFGLALDKTPTNDVDRTPRLPDQDRTWIAFGVQHKLSGGGVLDFGYAHEFVRDARVSTAAAPAPGRLNGTFENKADIITFGYSHSF